MSHQQRSIATLPRLDAGALIVMSTLLVPPEGAPALESAFRDRLGAVDGWEGHHGLQVWQDAHRAGRYAMTSWWSDDRVFARYMQSPAHAASHARVPHGEHAPALESVHRYRLLST